MPSTVLEDLTPRLQAAAAAVADARGALTLRVAALKSLIRDAVEEGMSQKQIAAAAGYRSPARITQILAEGDDR